MTPGRVGRQESPVSALFALEVRVARFFQTGPGQYGEGDVFIGLKMPVLRAVVRRCATLPLTEVE